MTETLGKRSRDPEDTSRWLCGYSGKSYSVTDAMYPKDSHFKLIGELKHPYRMSLERPFHRWLRKDGLITPHDPANVILTMWCINLLKQSAPPTILPYMK